MIADPRPLALEEILAGLPPIVEHLKEMCVARLAAGMREYGDQYLRTDLIRELQEEIADSVVYSALIACGHPSPDTQQLTAVIARLAAAMWLASERLRQVV